MISKFFWSEVIVLEIRVIRFLNQKSSANSAYDQERIKSWSNKIFRRFVFHYSRLSQKNTPENLFLIIKIFFAPQVGYSHCMTLEMSYWVLMVFNNSFKIKLRNSCWSCFKVFSLFLFPLKSMRIFFNHFIHI